VDLEGLVVGDMHVQPNIMFATDGRYDNSSTKEQAQRDEIDWISARQHGECRGQDPISKMLNVQEPVIPGHNDPGFAIATDVRRKLEASPLPAAPALASAPVKRRKMLPLRLAKK